jgi:hypothetical protein
MLILLSSPAWRTHHPPFPRPTLQTSKHFNTHRINKCSASRNKAKQPRFSVPSPPRKFRKEEFRCLIFFLFWNRVSLYSPGWPGTGHFPSSDSWVLGLQVCTTTPSSNHFSEHNWVNGKFFLEINVDNHHNKHISHHPAISIKKEMSLSTFILHQLVQICTWPLLNSGCQENLHWFPIMYFYHHVRGK